VAVPDFASLQIQQYDPPRPAPAFSLPDLKGRNATLAVVHKHRMGSCTGQLLATPQGLRYETSDKDDRFDVPLKDIETFTVDYQDKNLRVKVRKGKQYNFTDPDGNSDRLFVFHRDVEKVRLRVAQE